MEKKISEKDGTIIYSIRKNCRFRYENDNDTPPPKEGWIDEETFSIKTLIEK